MKDDDFIELLKYMMDRFDKLKRILGVKANDEGIQTALRTSDSLLLNTNKSLTTNA
jgi:hypothetical protein